MAAPNIVGVTTITAQTAVASVSTTSANVITNASGSNKVIKLNCVSLTNYSGSPVTANVAINRSSTQYFLGGAVNIPAHSTLVLLGKDTSVYLEEGDVVQAAASANSSLHMLASYEVIS